MTESIEQLSFKLTGDALAEQERALAGLSDFLALSCALLAAEVILWTLSLGRGPDASSTIHNLCRHVTQTVLPKPRPPAQLPAIAPGFAIPEKRGGLLGGK